MSIPKRLLSAALSCAMVCTSLVSAAVGAEYYDYNYYDNTYYDESKEAYDDYSWNDGNTYGSETPFDVFGIYDAYQERAAMETAPAEDPYYEPSTTTTATVTSETTTVTTTLRTLPEETTLEQTAPPETSTVTTAAPVLTYFKDSWGIDVSQWQGVIDWQKVKEAGVEFAIIRAGYGRVLSQKDPYFDTNVKNAKAAGLDVGVYWYSYATTVEGARQEAEVCYEVIKNYDFTYPIYFDLEDPTQMNLSSATLSGMTDAFCSAIESKGYYAGIYSGAWFLTKIYQSVLSKYVTWVAHYGVSSPSYKGLYGIWQYSCTGKINGIKGDVDLNYGYVDYPSIIKGLPPGSVQTTAVQTTAVPATTTTQIKGMEAAASNGNIDWNAVKNSGVSFAILNIGAGGAELHADEKFIENYNAAGAAGINRGASFYTRATTVEEAEKEAEYCYNIIKDMKFEYPVYIEIQDDSVTNANLTTEQRTALADTFCGYLQEKGFYAAIYSYQTYLTSHMDSSIFDVYDLWIANYTTSSKPTFVKKYGMWHYTQDGSVDGVQGSVRLSYCYRDYPEVMKYYHLNNY